MGGMACGGGQEGGVWTERPSEGLLLPQSPRPQCVLAFGLPRKAFPSQQVASSPGGGGAPSLEPPCHKLGCLWPSWSSDRSEPQPRALPGPASLTSEACFFPPLALRLYGGKREVTRSWEGPVLSLELPGMPTPGEVGSPALTYLSGHRVALIHQPPHRP